MAPGERLRGDESGLIGVGTVIALGIAGLCVYLLLAAFDADPSHYGAVDVPATSVPVDLPGGDTDVYYAASVDGDAEGGLPVPEELNIEVVDGEGESVRVDDRGGDTEDVEGGDTDRKTRLVAAVLAPGEGRYFVSVSSDGVDPRLEPRITFGQSPTGAVKERFEDIVDELEGPTGLIVLAGLALLFFAPRFVRAFGR